MALLVEFDEAELDSKVETDSEEDEELTEDELSLVATEEGRFCCNSL